MRLLSEVDGRDIVAPALAGSQMIREIPLSIPR